MIPRHVPVMQRRHYQYVASILRNRVKWGATPADRYIAEGIARFFASTFAHEQPNFDQERFLFAAGVGSPVEGSKRAKELARDLA
jgi:hypothetical protein